jgi:alpha-galactosidase
MKQRIAWMVPSIVLGVFLTSVGLRAAGYTDIAVQDDPTHEIRYTTDRVVYVEGLVDGRWVGRYWNAGGRINVPGELSHADDDAFGLQIEGQWLSVGWRWVGAHEEPRTSRGSRHFVVELQSTLRPIDLKIHTLLDGTPVLVRWLEITNTSSKATAITAVYPWSSRLWKAGDYRPAMANESDPVFKVGYFTEVSHGWEGWFRWFPLKDQTLNARYDVGYGANDPFFIAKNEATGEYSIGHLAWTGNWQMDFTSDQDTPGAGGMPGMNGSASLWMKIGPYASSALRVIKGGETTSTCEVHLGQIQGDLDTAVQAMQSHIRLSVVPTRPPERSYRIQYGVPADQGYIATKPGSREGMTEASMKKQIDLAAALGAELFIVDYGWWDVYGDWKPSPTRFPHGLGPVADYAHQKGMLFGIYSTFEGGQDDWTACSWCKQHPDWFLPNYKSKNMLDLTNPAVVAHLEAQLSRMIEDFKLDLYRHDFNNPFLGELGEKQREGFQENDYWRYYEGWYGILERIHKKYPNVILQQAACGGMRNDLGMISRWHEPYLTDGLNMPHVLRNYSGQTMALPPENFVIAFGLPARPANRGHLDTHLRVTYSLSTPWVATAAPSLEEMNPEIRQKYLHYADIYKSFIRPLLPTCKMYHHAPVTATSGVDGGPWFAVEFASPDRAKGWATIVRMAGGGSDTYVLRPRGLDPGKSYRVTFDSMGTTATVDGLSLMRDGLPIRLESNLSSELLLFEVQ